MNIRSTTNAASVEYAHSIGLLFATYAPFEASFEPKNEKVVYQIEADFHVTDRLDPMLDSSAYSPGTGGGDPEEWEKLDWGQAFDLRFHDRAGARHDRQAKQ